MNQTAGKEVTVLSLYIVSFLLYGAIGVFYIYKLATQWN